jgi:hypothetical protein
MSARRDVVAGPTLHRTQGQTGAGRTEQRVQAYDLRLGGLTLRQIGERMGVSHGTVQNLLREEIANRLDPLKDQYLQYELDRLDHMQQAVLAVLQQPWTVVTVAYETGEIDDDGKPEWGLRNIAIPDDRKILGAVDRLVRISESRRKLCGLDAPVKVQADVQVTETTQEDLELQELIREAKAKADTAHAERMRMMGGDSE